jgi:ribosomal protein L7/L12
MDMISWLFYSLGVVILWQFYNQIKTNNRRLAEIERKVDLLLQQLETEDTDVNLESVESYLARGDKLQAIKVFRELNPGTSLQEAADVVTALERELKQQQLN